MACDAFKVKVYLQVDFFTFWIHNVIFKTSVRSLLMSVIGRVLCSYDRGCNPSLLFVKPCLTSLGIGREKSLSSQEKLGLL